MVQRYTADGYGAQQGEMMPDPEGPWMLAADHARIVAEAAAQAREAAYREMTDERHSWPGPRGFDYDKGYEQGKADAEQAHAAALAAARAEGFESAHNEWAKALPEHLRVDRLLRAPRTLTAGDPEPAVVSVVLDKDGTAGQRVYTDDGVTTIWQFSDDDWCHEWGTVDRVRGPITLIHDGEDR